MAIDGASNLLFSTREQGHTLLAINGTYIGKVESYNNWFTQIFAIIGLAFGLTERVQINFNAHYFDRKSYDALLSKYQLNTANNRSNLDVLKYAIKPNQIDYMRAHVSYEKKQKLNKKLIQAIVNYTCEYDRSLRHDRYAPILKAIKYVGKGADVNTFFWLRGGNELGIPLKHYMSGLDKHKSYKFDAIKHTPLTLAGEYQLKRLCDILEKCGAKEELQGEQIECKWEADPVYYSESTDLAYYNLTESITHQFNLVYHKTMKTVEKRLDPRIFKPTVRTIPLSMP